jgi:hypothetical protein
MKKKVDLLRHDHDQFKLVLEEAEKLRWRKLQDYGQSYKNFGSFGIVVRLGDKMARITNLIQKNKKPNNESIRDNLLDILNYAAMGIMELDREVV